MQYYCREQNYLIIFVLNLNREGEYETNTV